MSHDPWSENPQVPPAKKGGAATGVVQRPEGFLRRYGRWLLAGVVGLIALVAFVFAVGLLGAFLQLGGRPGADKPVVWHGPPGRLIDPRRIDRRVAHLTVNGLTFHVPRRYIGFGRNEPDGETDGILFSFYLPEMVSQGEFDAMPPAEQRRSGTPSWTFGSVNDIRRTRDWCDEKGCRGQLFRWYQIDLESPPRKLPSQLLCPKEGKELPELGLTAYPAGDAHSAGIRHELLVSGDPCAPDFYLKCSIPSALVKNPGCKMTFTYRERVLVGYSFDRSELAHYREIHDKWVRKLDEFTAEIPSAEEEKGSRP